MITGIGTDLIDIRRIENVFLKYGTRFEKKVFTEKEINSANKINNLKKRYSFYAKRFAAKEAYVKAMGRGIGKDIKFKDISVNKKPSGQPFIELSNASNKGIFLSLSDDYPYAQAFVVVSKE